MNISVYQDHTKGLYKSMQLKILNFATCAVQIRYISTFRKALIRGFITLSRYFHIHPHSQPPCAKKSRYLTFARLQNLIQRQCDTVNLTPPCKILYYACKDTSCKIIHATHAKQGATKTEQSRRNCKIKQQFI
jgi:hypothetical protein